MVFNHVRLLAPKVEHIHILTFIEQQEQRALADELERTFENVSVQTVLLPPSRSRLGALRGLISSDLPLQLHYYRSRDYASALRDTVARQPFDACYIQLIRMAQYMHLLLPMTKVLALTDCLTLRYERSAPYVRGWTAFVDARERQRVTRYETAITGEADVSFVVNGADRDKLVALGAKGRLAVLELGVDLDYFQPNHEEKPEPRSAVLVGNFHSVPNQDAVRYAVHDVWPLVRDRFPDARLEIVGILVPKWIRALDGKDGVVVRGGVDDVRPHLWRSALSLCPMRIAAGTQFKVIESLALGVPVVTTPLALEGLGPDGGKGILVGENPESMARAVASVFESSARRDDLARQGRAFVEEHFNWQDRAERLLELMGGGNPSQGGQQPGR